jgi:type III pantothenate kinase
MNLAIDIGNTSVKAALFEKNVLKEAHVHRFELDELLQKYRIAWAIISKSGEDTEIEEQLRQKAIPYIVLSRNLNLPIGITYATPDTLGADRIAGSVAANAQFRHTPVLKIDFGTCITYDLINAQNELEGGAISPGMMMRFKALHNYTARLPLIDPMQFTQYPLTGTDTAHSILSGVMNGIKNEVEGIIKEYEARLGKLNVVATGGDSGLFVTLLKSEIFARPYLVLEGLNIILNNNK